MKIGFSGSRLGMTSEQRNVVINWLHAQYGVTEAHHGDCIGADEEFDGILSISSGATIIVHPPVNEAYRAFCSSPFHTILPAKEYHARNADIVDSCDLLLATPRPGGRGTIWTINYAERKKHPALVILPTGFVWKEKSRRL